MQRSSSKRIALALTVLIGAVVVSMVTPTAGGAIQPTAVTATNGTIPIAGLGFTNNFADAGIGAAARFKRANDTTEVKGYTFDYKEFANDKNDPVSALAETRRLVAQDQIFALVPDVSLATPGDYLTQQQIPWFGPGYDVTYCPPSGKGGFGFGTYGCLLPANPKKFPGLNSELLKKALASKGIAKPAVALIGTDAQSGKQGIQNTASVMEGVGFNVVYAKGSVPAPPAVVGDYTPYAQALLASNNGKQPDVIYSTIAPAGTLQLINLLKSNGYTGTFFSPFYTNILLKPLTGAYVFLQQAAYESQSANMTQLKNDVQAFKPSQQYTLTLGGGYLAADMFIAAVKASLHKSKTLTSASVQKAASTMTYYWKDVVGPTSYPASYTYSVKACATLLYDADGTAFTIVKPYTCSAKTYPILKKYANG